MGSKRAWETKKSTLQGSIFNIYKMVFLKEKYQIATADQKLTSVEITHTPKNVIMTLKLASWVNE